MAKNQSGLKDSSSKKNGKRGQGEGSIYKRKDGRWAAVVNLGYQDGKLKRKTFYGKTHADVKDKLIAALNDVQKGIPIVTERQTLKEFLDRWLQDSVKPSVRPTTFISYSTQVDVHIIPALGKHQLTKLTPQHVQAFLKNKLQSGMSASTLKHCLTILRIALNQALRWNLVSRNVATLVDSPRVEQREFEPLTPEQVVAFLKAAQGEKCGLLFMVAISTGLRKGELLGLKWQDINFDESYLRVNRSLQRIRKNLVLLEPKTKKSKRLVPLPTVLIPRLREHRARQLERKLAAGPNKYIDNDLVFPTGIGTPLDPRHINTFLKPILEKAGLPHYSVHDLRHQFASLMIAQDAQLKLVSDILGHSQIGITANLYVHLTDAVKMNAMDKMNKILTGTD